jgi:hypothetical protein
MRDKGRRLLKLIKGAASSSQNPSWEQHLFNQLAMMKKFIHMKIRKKI